MKCQVHKDPPIGLKINGNDLLEMFKIFWIDSRSMKSHKAIGGQIFKMFRLSWNYKKWSLWNSFETIKGTQRHQRLSLKMFQLSWKLLEMILTIFWTCYRHLEIDSRALRGPIGRVFSFLWLYNQPFYMPPNLPRALRKGAVSSSFFLLSSSNNLLLFASSSTCFIRFRPNLVRMTIGWVATKVINSLTSKVM